MSSLFNLKPPLQSKPLSRHPWANTIKDILSHRIKHAHNSARNPKYPKLKERVPDAERIQFTVIGDRVTKEFIYCVNLVKGLHKYRWKKFDVPAIRGVNTVEWEDVWRSLKLQHGGLAHCLKSRVAVLIGDKFLGGEEELKELIESKYIYHLILDYCSEAVANFASYIRCSGRSCAYMHIAINEEHIGTLVFMLYSDIVPYTSENFLRLCKDTRGGYSGTPIHRIVKDGWIQGGGFNLKNTDLECENFIVPHDRRGVLCMANDGRHMDCSTQFFVILQPAPWMAYRYVAFGQLIEGDETLKKIEAVPTWYESPKEEIIIYKAGIFNMECQDIMINKGANEYIDGHIEDLNALGELLIENLIERVYLEIELKMVERLTKELLGEGEEEKEGEAGNLRATKRFMRKKEEIEKQLQSQAKMPSQVKTQQSQIRGQPAQSAKSMQSQSMKSQVMSDENNEFDVEEYEPEETTYKHLSIAATLSLIVKPQRPFYIPLTDVPYPGDVDSTYDLKKFLQGHYCLESDLVTDATIKTPAQMKVSFPSEILFDFQFDNESESESSQSLESDDEKEIRQYLKNNVDRVSFAGGVIKTIARGAGKLNLFENARKSELITDDELRRLRLASIDYRQREASHDKKVSISIPFADKEVHTKIKRRQTGFVRPEDLEKIHIFKTEQGMEEEDIDTPRKVRIAPSAMATTAPPRPLRRPTGFVRPTDIIDSDTDMVRQSVLQRLYDDVTYDDDQGPTLKDYKPFSETHQKSILLTFSPNARIRSEEDTRDKYLRHSIQVDRDEVSYEQVLNLQHGKKVARKISSDYVKTIDQIEHKTEVSLRSIEFAKSRPALSVAEYQLKNQKYQEELRMSKVISKLQMKSTTSHSGKKKHTGLRLPGDTPLYSFCDGLDLSHIQMMK
ncbi:uncharacterized protein LOC114364591 isoform X2 [Ostrinia furnacalis]|uniref:uncharacterized protein LOC114364591 isoform X2 n=1 Tax=Ostrinia furnacalis TaxID=93504 RepID=UPI00103DEDE6|nr:uncharacterized protein LOC114364591 isoform X2 [Ostrinia furnacalis]